MKKRGFVVENKLELLMAFGVGVYVGHKWPAIRPYLEPFSEKLVDRLSGTFGQIVKQGAEVKEMLEDRYAEQALADVPIEMPVADIHQGNANADYEVRREELARA